MPRDANGNYTLPAGNPVQSGTLITTTWANATMPDLGAELSDSLSRSGKGAMTAPLQIIDESGPAPGLVFRDEGNSGLRREAAGDVRLRKLGTDLLRTNPTANRIDVWSALSSRWLPLPQSDYYNVRDEGADETGATNNKALFQQILDAGGVTYFPKPSNYYLIDGPLIVPSNAVLLGRHSRIHNIPAGGSGFWGKTHLLIGTYFGHSSTEGFQAQTPYTLQPISPQDRVLTFATPGDSANFSVGDVVLVRDGTPWGASNPTTLFENASFNKVIAVGSGTVTLEHCIKDKMPETTGGNAPVIYREENPTISDPSHPDLDGQVSRIAQNVLVQGLHLTADNPNNSDQPVHIAGYNVEFRNCEIDGNTSFGINPGYNLNIHHNHFKYRRSCAEFAYGTEDCSFTYNKCNRTGEAVASNPDVWTAEMGCDNIIAHNVINSKYDATLMTSPAISASRQKRTQIIGNHVFGAHTGIAVTATDNNNRSGAGSIIANNRVFNYEVRGIFNAANGVHIIGNRVGPVNTPGANRQCIQPFTTAAAPFGIVCHDNMCGPDDPSKFTKYDGINAGSKEPVSITLPFYNHIRDNPSAVNLLKWQYKATAGGALSAVDYAHGVVDINDFISGFNATSWEDVVVITVPADHSAPKQGWKFDIRANASNAATNDVKSIRLLVSDGTTDVVLHQIDFQAADDGARGSLVMKADFLKRANNSTAIFDAWIRTMTNGGGATAGAPVATAYDVSNILAPAVSIQFNVDVTFKLQFQVANAADSIVFRRFRIESYNDQVNTTLA